MAILFKPKKKTMPAFKVLKDGREVCTDTRQGHLEYRSRTEQMARRQEMVCCLCKDYRNPMSLARGFAFSATFEHTNGGKGGGKGMGGSRTDDRIVDADGNWLNGASHWECNSRMGSKRYVSVSASRPTDATSSPSGI